MSMFCQACEGTGNDGKCRECLRTGKLQKEPHADITTPLHLEEIRSRPAMTTQSSSDARMVPPKSMWFHVKYPNHVSMGWIRWEFISFQVVREGYVVIAWQAQVHYAEKTPWQ